MCAAWPPAPRPSKTRTSGQPLLDVGEWAVRIRSLHLFAQARTALIERQRDTVEARADGGGRSGSSLHHQRARGRSRRASRRNPERRPLSHDRGPRVAKPGASEARARRAVSQRPRDDAPGRGLAPSRSRASAGDRRKRAADLERHHLHGSDRSANPSVADARGGSARRAGRDHQGQLVRLTAVARLARRSIRTRARSAEEITPDRPLERAAPGDGRASRASSRTIGCARAAIRRSARHRESSRRAGRAPRQPRLSASAQA